MKIRVNGVFRPPISVEEYFTILCCERRELVPTKLLTRYAKQVWKSLTPAEKKVFIDNFEKWQAENNKKINTILEYVEPFLKKKTNTTKGNAESNLNETKNECDADDKLSIHTIDDISNSYSEVSKHENLNVEFYMDDYDNNQSESLMNLVYDDTSNATLEVSKPSTSVIDEDIDEPAAPEVNEPMTEKLPEPTPLPLINARELFEIIKSSGTRPHLATVEWKDLSRSQRYPWGAALTAIKKQYLVKYREYLESLSSPELFKHYNKYKMGY